MSSESGFQIELLSTGDEGSAFRMRNWPPGQTQRPHIIQDGSDLTVKGDLFSVIHGRETPDGASGTLIVVDFQFIGSVPQQRRFRKAIIEIRFAHEDQKVGTEFDPEVLSIAPCGSFLKSPSSEERESTIGANLGANAGLSGLAGVELGAQWQLRTAGKKETWTSLFGSVRVEEREWGTSNTARWTITENELDRHGIPSLLRTAILVKPKTAGRFRALVAVDTEVDFLYAAKKVAKGCVKGFRGWNVVDPVYFDQKTNFKDTNVENIDMNNLSACNLDSIALVESITDKTYDYQAGELI
ncbi:hypothetical protein K440DRAFT_638754 [Wilcoxina mikolae CBS 423.85]|nr:hypothetical protein K440DRAFT_638754 [Wilcoxina mikolae CBS 423.85]